MHNPIALGRFTRYVRLYAAYFRANWLGLMSYRTDFIIRNLCNIILMTASLGLLGVVMSDVKVLKGWSYEQLLLIYALTSISRAVWHLLCVNIISIGIYVQKGDMDRLLMRPVDPLFQLVADYLDNDDWGELVLGIVLLAIAWRMNGLPVSVAAVAWAVVTILSGFLIYFAIHLFFNTFAFWIVNNKPVERLAWELDRFTTYPMTVYASGLKLVLTWILPFGFVAFYPSEFFFQGNGSGFWWAAPAVGLIACLLAYRFWLFGLSKYQGTGS